MTTSELNRKVFERAKEAGINVSGIAAQLLGAIRTRPKRGSALDDLSGAYESFFRKMTDIMLDYHVDSVIVGWEYHDDEFQEYKEPIFWTPKGFFIGQIEGEGDDGFGEYVYNLDEPSEIFYNLISKLDTAEDSKRRIKDLELALLSVESGSKDYGHRDDN